MIIRADTPLEAVEAIVRYIGRYRRGCQEKAMTSTDVTRGHWQSVANSCDAMMEDIRAAKIEPKEPT